jgi:hypothetical protein
MVLSRSCDPLNFKATLTPAGEIKNLVNFNSEEKDILEFFFSLYGFDFLFLFLDSLHFLPPIIYLMDAEVVN